MKKMSITLEREIVQEITSNYSGLLKVKFYNKNGAFKQGITLDKNNCSPVIYMDNIPELFQKCLQTKNRTLVNWFLFYTKR